MSTNIIDLRNGKRHILLLDCNGKLFAFGEGTYGETGININTLKKHSLKDKNKPRLVNYFSD